MPERIQRCRSKGWRMPEGAVYVGRPSLWGNPFVVGELHFPPMSGKPNGPANPIQFPPIRVRDRAHAVDLFRELYAHYLSPDYHDSAVFRDALAKLRGKDLVCWCPLGQPCHADVLLKIANRDA